MAQVVDNAGRLRVKGIEGDFNWRMGAFTLRGAAAYNHARYQDYVGQCYPGQTIAQGYSLIAALGGAFTSQDYDGRTPPKAPRFSGRIGFALDLPAGRSRPTAICPIPAATTSSTRCVRTACRMPLPRSTPRSA